MDWTVSQTALIFSDVGVNRTSSDSPLTVTIVDDDVAEPREFFVCSLLFRKADPVRSITPYQVTVCIIDNDGMTG